MKTHGFGVILIWSMLICSEGSPESKSSPDVTVLIARLQLTESTLVETTKQLSETTAELNALKSVVDRIVTGDIAKSRRIERAAAPGTTETLTGAGVTYIRWGRTVCSGTVGAFAIYRGFVGGTRYDTYKGGVTALCLHDDPVWGNYNDAGGAGNWIYGAEYEFSDMPFSTINNANMSLMQHDVPCVACFAPYQSVQIMIPGRFDCPNSGNWTKEYSGYLVADSLGTYSRSDFICMDEAPETIEGGSANVNGLLFNTVGGKCTPLPCPPYVDGRQMPCVVCTH